mmetsp:Transcript_14589/g.50714  ORF Transcript_14589/g.50714 Transcript_14589/m.50714 type:complete len:201 (-) Transcript_14589:1844-2446(-)
MGPRGAAGRAFGGARRDGRRALNRARHRPASQQLLSHPAPAGPAPAGRRARIHARGLRLPPCSLRVRGFRDDQEPYRARRRRVSSRLPRGVLGDGVRTRRRRLPALPGPGERNARRAQARSVPSDGEDHGKVAPHQTRAGHDARRKSALGRPAGARAHHHHARRGDGRRGLICRTAGVVELVLLAFIFILRRRRGRRGRF